ncbi:MAG: AMIN-like domain-containing (lipo)protein, partial [Pseudonocardiaceae bacterium]
TQPSAPRTYTGPSRIKLGTPEVVEMVRTGGFEGVLNWVVGLNDRVDFRVTTLAAPPRIVVDFRNH